MIQNPTRQEMGFLPSGQVQSTVQVKCPERGAGTEGVRHPAAASQAQGPSSQGDNCPLQPGTAGTWAQGVGVS